MQGPRMEGDTGRPFQGMTHPRVANAPLIQFPIKGSDQPLAAPRDDDGGDAVWGCAANGSSAAEDSCPATQNSPAFPPLSCPRASLHRNQGPWQREREMKDVPRARSASVILKCTLKDCSKRKPFTLEET